MDYEEWVECVDVLVKILEWGYLYKILKLEVVVGGSV